MPFGLCRSGAYNSKIFKISMKKYINFQNKQIMYSKYSLPLHSAGAQGTAKAGLLETIGQRERAREVCVCFCVSVCACVFVSSMSANGSVHVKCVCVCVSECVSCVSLCIFCVYVYVCVCV